MSILVKIISIFKVDNKKIFSFFIPIPLLLFLPLFSSSLFFNPNKVLNQNISKYSFSVLKRDEIKELQDTIRVEDLNVQDEEERESVLLLNNSTKIDSSLTVDDKENLKDIGLTKKSSIRVLMFGYHQVREIKSTDGPKTKIFITKPEIFDKEMKFLYDKGYHTISTTDYIDYLNTGKANFDISKSFILTLDDGYESQYINAFPIIKKYGFTATFFIYADCIDKYPACMTSLQVKDLALNGMKIGNHTTHHLFLPKYSDKIIKDEISVSKEKIIKMVGTSSVENVFAYPYGATNDRIESIVKDSGYYGAIGVIASKKEDKNLFNLKRYLMGEDYDYFKSLIYN